MMNNNNLKVTVNDVCELINSDSKFTAKLLANKDRVAVYDSNNKTAFECAYRNKKASFSFAVQCNRFSAQTMKEYSEMLDTDFKYHKTKNHRDYVTFNRADSDDVLNFIFEMLDSIIDA